MKVLKLLSLLIFMSLFITTCNKSIGSGDDNPYKQEHIPWPSLADSPWPTLRHDAQGTGRSQYSGPQIGELITTLSDSVYIKGSFIIGENNSFYGIGTYSKVSHLYRFSESGSVEWEYEFEAYYDNHITPTLSSDGILYFSEQNKRILYAVNASDGTKVWSMNIGGTISSNVVLDMEGNLYLIISDPRKLISLTPDGSTRWMLSDLGDFHTGLHPLVFSPDGGVLYSSAGDSLYAITTDGEKVWGHWTKEWVFYEMVDNDGNIYFYNKGDSSLTCLLPSGDVRWKTVLSEFNARRITGNIAPTIDSDGNIYFLGKLLDGTYGIISFDNEGIFRWIWEAYLGTDLICDKDNTIFYSYTDDTDMHFLSLSSEGILNWEFQIEYSGGMATNTPSIGSNGSGIFPLQNNWRMPIVLIR